MYRHHEAIVSISQNGFSDTGRVAVRIPITGSSPALTCDYGRGWWVDTARPSRSPRLISCA
jgi:hypothetical protein